MAEQVRIRRDSDDIASTHTGVAGELGYNTTDGTIHAVADDHRSGTVAGY